MLSTKIRTTIIALIAAGSFATMVPAAAQAQPVKQKDLEGKGYTCEHVATNMTICTDTNGHEWACEESTDECGQLRLQVVTTTKLPEPTLKLTIPVLSVGSRLAA
jgi:hypothetical protein